MLKTIAAAGFGVCSLAAAPNPAPNIKMRATHVMVGEMKKAGEKPYYIVKMNGRMYAMVNLADFDQMTAVLQTQQGY